MNEYSEMELYRIIRDYGEEKFAKNIAKHIVNARKEKALETTGELIHVIKAAIPMKVRAVGEHPAKKTFQAIRIAVNGELDHLSETTRDFIDILAPGGILTVITFHSLEDRAVKQAMRQAENPCTCPPDFPVCVCGRKPEVRLVNKKPITSTEEELDENPRARSAKLRVAEKR